MHRILSIEEIKGRSRRRSDGTEKMNPARVKLCVTMEEGERFFISSLKASRLGLKEGEEIAEDVYETIFQSLRSSCMQRCGNLLGSRDYSVQRMRDKLCEAGYPDSVVHEAIGKLREAGYLDDRRFAQSYVRSHMQDRSRMRIMRDLAGKGISETVIEEAFAAVAEEENLEDAQRDQVLRLLKKRGFDPAQASYEEKQKTMAFLHRKGYPADLIRRLTGGCDEW